MKNKANNKKVRANNKLEAAGELSPRTNKNGGGCAVDSNCSSVENCGCGSPSKK